LEHSQLDAHSLKAPASTADTRISHISAETAPPHFPEHPKRQYFSFRANLL